MHVLDDELTLRTWRIRAKLTEGRRAAIFAGQGADGTPVIIKSLKDAFPSRRARAALHREHRLLAKLRAAGVDVVEPLALEEIDGHLALVLRDVGAGTLDERIQRGPMEIDAGLQIALAVTQALGAIHAQDVIHKDVKPANILVAPDGARAWLIDFEVSSDLGREAPRVTSRAEGTLAYIAPEQTGRMNRPVDRRSDYYALGITLFELFTGRRPFQATDPMELIHAHLARRPPPADAVHPGVPACLAAVLDKLLAKSAEDRYQSADGLVADLARCRRRIADGLVEPFPLGEDDVSQELGSPGRLYGRREEVDALLGAFDAARDARAALALIAGWSGVGKSALIAELHRPVVRHGGLFLRGKFDQVRRSVPYSAFIAAFDGLVDQLLSRPGAELAVWRERISAALGDVGGVITAVIPRLESLVGAQPPPPELPAEPARNRFVQVFVDFAKSCLRPGRPVVLVLDDLQWADRASLDLIRLLLSDPSVRDLLVIGAYRDNEVDAAHPLSLMLTELGALDDGPARTDLHLDGLERVDLLALVADMLRADPADVAELADVVLGKTLGNPFFVLRFLEDLHTRGVIRFADRRWQWDAEALAAASLTDNVVELMSQRLDRQPEPVKRALRVAAALGSVFSLEDLSEVLRQEPRKTADALWPALREGLVVPMDTLYRLVGTAAAIDLNPRYGFQHDRVQQAAYLLTPEEERPALHLEAGRALLAAGRADADIFAVVDQLGHGLELIDEPDERLAVARLFGRAGRRARLASAVAPTIEYLRTAIDLLGPTAWDTHYDERHALGSALAEALYLAGRDALPEAEATIDELLERSRTTLEKVRVHQLRIYVFTNRGQFVEAVDDALIALRLCGERIPRRPGMPAMLWELMKVKMALRGRPLSAIADFPEATDELKVEAIRILNNIAAAGTFIAIELGSTIILRMCVLSARHGNSGASAFGWALYGMILGPVLGDYPGALELLRVSEHLDTALPDLPTRSKLKGAQGGMLAHWGAHPSAALPYLDDSFRSGLEAGDPLHAHYATCQAMYVRLLQGDKLDLVDELAAQYMEYAIQNGMEEARETFTIERRMVAALRGQTDGTDSFSGSGFDEDAFVARISRMTMQIPLHVYACVKAQVLYIFGHHRACLEMVELSKTLEDGSTGLPHRSLQNVYEVLAWCALWPELSKRERRTARKAFKKNLAKLTLWATHAPDNFQHKVLMLQAEIARVEGRKDDAASLIDAAIDAVAKQPVFHQNRALANELAGLLHHRAGRSRVAEVYLRGAREAWREWGATAKVAELDARFPQIAVRNRADASTVTRLALALSETPPRHTAGAFDMLTVVKATEAISGEIVFDQLLARLMSLANEHAGARRALLVLEDGDGPVIRAERRVDGETLVALSQPLDERGDFSSAVIQYVRHTREPVNIEDTADAGSFASCPWLAEGRTRSVLAVPLIRGEDLVGVLYLENDLAAGVFGRERLELMGLLSSQIAIALENARLYSDAEELADAYSRFVPREFLRFLGTEDVRRIALGDSVERDMTVLFADIRNFTAMSEQLPPSETFRLLNEYLSRVGPVIREQGGFIDKYIGDAIMALFPNRSEDALAAALRMHEEVDALNGDRAETGLPAIQIGVGLHQGRLVLGTIGEERRLDGTVISDAVNVAARLEGLTKTFGASILVSGSMLDELRLSRPVQSRYLGEVRPRGRREPVRVHEIYEGLSRRRQEALEWTREDVETAMRMLFSGRTGDALELLQDVARRDPDDEAAAYYVRRIERILAEIASGDLEEGSVHTTLSTPTVN